MWHDPWNESWLTHMWHDPCTSVTQRIHMRHDSSMCGIRNHKSIFVSPLPRYVSWLTHMGHDAFIYDFTHSYVTCHTHTSRYVTCPIHTWHVPFIRDMTHPHVTRHTHIWHDSFIWVVSHMYICGTTYLYVTFRFQDRKNYLGSTYLRSSIQIK